MSSVNSDDSEIIAAQWNLLSEREPRIAERIYERFFQSDTRIARLFGAHCRAVKEDMLHETLTGMVMCSEGTDWLVSNLKLLGAKHVEFDVSDEMYDLWTESVLGVLSELSGPSWGSSLERLWRERIEYLCSVMREAASQPELEGTG